LAANLALLLNMARRLPFGVAQAITIIGWYISGFLLIALVAVANSKSSGFRLQPSEQHALSQAFYYGILASILYLIIASLMVFTVVGAYRDHYKKEFSLTTAQRTLMIQTVLFMMYLLLGALVFKHVENWQYEDAVYWADFTLLTIGLGVPFAPVTHLGRLLLFPFAIGGILTVGLVIGSIRSLVLDRGKQKLRARFIEKKREQTINSVDTKHDTITVSWFRKYPFTQEGLSEPRRREQEFNIMRKIQDEAHTREKYMALLTSSIAGLILWLVGAAVFAVCERPQGWTYFTALYFSYTSLLTIGYGDVQPVSNSGKPFFVLWTILAVPTLTILISNLGDTVIKAFADLAIWAGSVTILPGESAIMQELKMVLHSITRGAKINPKELRFDKPPGFIAHSSDDDKGEDLDAEIRQHVLDRLAKHLEDEELDDAKEANDEGDIRLRDIHIYHYVLVRELKNIVIDMNTNPHKQYSYRDWAWYLKLLRQDESDASLHRPAPTHVTSKEDVRGGFGRADASEKRKWSWLGARSPLMSTKTETEWLAERLGAALEVEMRKLRKGDMSEEAPISIGDLLKRRKEDKGESSGKANESDADAGATHDVDSELSQVKKDQ
jgi:potassium channel subfamily K, other eukaryote